MDLVLEKARSQSTSTNNKDITNKEESLSMDDVAQQIIHNLEENAEDYLDTQAMGDGDLEIYSELDKDDDSPTDSDAKVDYKSAARTFMQRQGIRKVGRREHKRRNNWVILCKFRLAIRLLYFCSLSFGGQFF